MKLTRGVTAAKPVACTEGKCAACELDAEYLKTEERPTVADGAPVVRVVDLFAGCGGMSVGLVEAAQRAGRRVEVALAADLDDRALTVLRNNLPGAKTKTVDVSTLFGGVPSKRLSDAERTLRKNVGNVDILVGGPPCQGHSDLNNHTRRSDPKNALYLRMARAAKVLQPWFVVVENVVAVQQDAGNVLTKTKNALGKLGYAVHGSVIDLSRAGVPQRRRRYLLLASRIPNLDPASVVEKLAALPGGHSARTVEWAIGDLQQPRGTSTYDRAGRATKINKKRIEYLFKKNLYDLPNSRRPECHKKGGHSYVSVYGRLHPDRPAQTITTGFGCMGQGRYVHPWQRRTITPHEAARLQTFPDWFQFGADTPRTALARMIGNAVPPLLMVALGSQLIPHLPAPAAVNGKPAKR